jgi:hypothetical protein
VLLRNSQTLSFPQSLVDLAGSESLAKTGTVEKVRMEEAKYNNKSLLTLTQVISRLSGGKPR